MHYGACHEGKCARKGKYLADTHHAEYANGRSSREVGGEETANEPRPVSREGEPQALPLTPRFPCEGSPHVNEVDGECDIGDGADGGGCDRGRPIEGGILHGDDGGQDKEGFTR